MIKDISEMPDRRIEIDLTGPQGNAFWLIGYARDLAKQLDRDPEDISTRMKSGDYENVVKIFEEEFGDYVTLYR